MVKGALLSDPILQLFNIIWKFLISFFLVYQILNENILDVLSQLGEWVVHDAFHILVTLGCRIKTKILPQLVKLIMPKFFLVELLKRPIKEVQLKFEFIKLDLCPFDAVFSANFSHFIGMIPPFLQLLEQNVLPS